jgi:hypothetical protein
MELDLNMTLLKPPISQLLAHLELCFARCQVLRRRMDDAELWEI